jgi:hypothetical protein
MNRAHLTMIFRMAHPSVFELRRERIASDPR